MAEENKPAPATDNVCLTKVNFRKSSYLWAIENYVSVHDKRKQTLKSASFSADDDEFKWCLHLNPYCDSTWISLYLYPSNECSNFTEHSPITGKLKFSILNAENVETCTQNMDFTLTTGSTVHTGFQNFVTRTTLFNEESKLLSQEKLTIFCELSYIKETDIVNVSGKPFSNSLEKREPACLEDIETLFRNEEFSDVTLSVKNEKYPAHKSILVARSSVFKAMLSHDMKEKQSNCIELQDIEVPVFEAMLRYIYSGKIQHLNLEELAPELLAAADRYDLKNLKTICEKELYGKLSIATAVNTLMWADMYHAENLKEQTLLFIKMHSYTSNMLEEQFRGALIKSFPHLLLEILDTFGKQSRM